MIFFLLTTIGSIGFAQTIQYLNLPSDGYFHDRKSPTMLRAHRCFDRDIHSLFLESEEGNAYYSLSDIQGDFTPLSIDSFMIPLSFFSEDCLLVYHKTLARYMLYDIYNHELCEIEDGPVRSLLQDLPPGVKKFCFNKSLDQCLYWDDSRIVHIGYDAIRKMAYSDTVFVAKPDVPILHAIILTDSLAAITSYDINRMREFTSIVDIQRKSIKKLECGYVLTDYLDGLCIIARYGWFVSEFDSKTLKMKKIKKFKFTGGRAGFISSNTITGFSGIWYDYELFDPQMRSNPPIEVQDYTE